VTGTPAEPGSLSRRRFLTGGAAAVGGVAAAGAGFAVGRASAPVPPPPPPPPADAVGRAVEPFHGPHQAGVATGVQAVGVFVALDLAPGTDRDALVRLMRLWTTDAERLTQGRPTLADTQPELATAPARLTMTVGYGPGVFDAAGLADQRPAWLAPLPPFGIDRLEDRWSGGDLLLHLAGDDPMAVAHAQRMALRSAAAFAGVRWVQSGFVRGAGVAASGTTPRNLMGQVDGTANPPPEDFDGVVWVGPGTGAPAWLQGGTGMVLRRIRMLLDTWDALDRGQREQVIGRRLDTGAPLTGTAERDPPDFEAVGPDGLLVIPEFAHIRLANATSSAPDAPTGTRILRRPFSYDDGVLPDGSPDVGLLFAAYAADIGAQFVPIQQRLAEQDLLNTWTTPVGSAVFALPPGTEPGGWIGEPLLG
jgi:dye decolorizing peroxidase